MNRRAAPALPLFLTEAFTGVARYPLRSSLALLGLVIGVAAVVGTLALITAARRLSIESFARFGAIDLVQVRSPDEISRNGRDIKVGKRVALNPDDRDRIRALLPELRDAMVHVTLTLPVRHGAASVETEIDGGGANTPGFFPFTRAAGRFLDPAEIENAARSAVISTGLAEDLFAEQPPVGEEILVKGQRFTVIGVVRPPKDFSGEERRVAYVPYRAAIERLGADPLDAELLFAAPSVERIGEARLAVERLLPHLRPGVGADSYEVESGEEALESVNAQARMQTLILGGVALLAMLAAGSGILNTLLVGVKERTREIGVRRAIGARRGTILRQFLAEAVVLAVPGSLLGLGAGILVAHRLGAILASGLDDPSILVIAIGRRETFAAAGVAVLVAALAGLWPAFQAAAVPPAEALRYE